jgi:uncharacterized membrane protein YccF (DUF307 family)
MTQQTSPPQQPRMVVVQNKSGPGCLVQALWFLFVGWWLGGILITIAWFLNITIIGLPLGMSILNNIPKVLALQEPTTQTRAISYQDGTIVRQTEQAQLNFWLRAIYFVVIGWWWSGIWLAVAYVLCGTIILIPVGLSMFRSTPAMTTLRNY